MVLVAGNSDLYLKLRQRLTALLANQVSEGFQAGISFDSSLLALAGLKEAIKAAYGAFFRSPLQDSLWCVRKLADYQTQFRCR
jgi:hypothetical protein